MSKEKIDPADAEKLCDAELSKRLGQYQARARIWLIAGLLGMAGGLICAAAVQDAVCKTILVAVLFGGGLCCALFLRGSAQKKLNALMQEQLGAFFREELEKAFGPELHTPEMRIDRALLKTLHLLEGQWEECVTERFREGRCRGIHFSAANVRLDHVYEQGHGRGSLGISRDMVCKGLVLRCETRVPAPTAICAKARAAGDPSGIATGDAAFDRRFCVTAEREQDVRAFLTPQLAAQFSSLAQALEGTLLGFRWEAHILSLVIQTDYGFAAVAGDTDLRDLDAVRRSYCNSLREIEKILDLLPENEALFTRQG